METTLVWAGVWTSLTVSFVLLGPVILTFCKRNLPMCFGLLMTLTGLYALAPYSAGARAVWIPLTQIPIEILKDLIALFSRVSGG
jgi:hypothetical protein